MKSVPFPRESAISSEVRYSNISADEIAALVSVLRHWGANDIAHSGVSLLDHLIGTHEILASWNQTRAVCLAGLFHSAYGQKGEQSIRTSIRREEVRLLIGKQSERLVWHFYHIDRPSWFARLESENINQIMKSLSFSACNHLLAANLLEQARRKSELLQLDRIRPLLTLIPHLSSIARNQVLRTLSKHGHEKPDGN